MLKHLLQTMRTGDGSLVGMSVLSKGMVPDEDEDDESSEEDVLEQSEEDESMETSAQTDSSPGPWLLLLTSRVRSVMNLR